MKKAVVAAGLLVAGSAVAAPPALPPLKVFTDEHTGVSFYYPKGWKNVAVADDASKAEASSDDGAGHLIVELMAGEAKVAKVLDERVRGGRRSTMSGGWACIEGDVEAGAKHALVCGRRVQVRDGAKKVGKAVVAGTLFVGLRATQSMWSSLGGKALVAKVAEGARGFKAPGGE